MRAVGVFGLLAFGVMFTVNGRPIFGHLTCGEPQPESEEMRHARMQVQGSVGLMTVQENGDTGNGDVRQAQNDKKDLPSRKTEQAIGQPVDHRIKHNRIENKHSLTFREGCQSRQSIDFKIFRLKLTENSAKFAQS